MSRGNAVWNALGWWRANETMMQMLCCISANFLHHHSPAELKKTTLEGSITSTKSVDCIHICTSTPSTPHWMLSYSASTSANRPHQNSSSLMYLNSLVKTNLPFTAGLMCVSDSCHLTPGLIRPVSLVSTFPACSPHPGAHRLASSSSST